MISNWIKMHIHKSGCLWCPRESYYSITYVIKIYLILGETKIIMKYTKSFVNAMKLILV